jgi:hypothetical protein
MRCPSCDAEVDSDDLYCGECGKRLPPKSRKDPKFRTPLIIGIAALVVFGCIVVGVTLAVIAGGVVPLSSQISPTAGQSHTPAMIPTSTATVPSPTPPTPSPEPAADPYEPDDSIEEAQPITTDGVPHVHNLHVRRDHDYVHFEAYEGTAYTMETSDLGGDVDTIVYLYDTEGNELAYADDGAQEPLASRIVWIAPSSGTYYVMIRDLGEESAGPDATY